MKSLINPSLHVERDSQSLAKYSWEIVNIKTKIIELKNVKKVKFVLRDEKISRFQPDCRQEDHKGQSNVTFSYVILMEVSKIWYVKDLLSLSNPSCKNVKFHHQFPCSSHFNFVAKPLLHKIAIVLIVLQLERNKRLLAKLARKSHVSYKLLVWIYIIMDENYLILKKLWNWRFSEYWIGFCLKTQCRNYGISLTPFFRKNSVKVTFYSKVWIDLTK